MATQRIGALVVDLIAESAQYVAELQKANKATNKWAKSTQKSIQSVARGVIGASAVLMAVNAIAEAFRNLMDTAREVESLSLLAGQSVEEFQAAAYAADQFGISTQQLGDISKDTSEKLGDFVATGGGEFQDFFEQVAPQVGLTAEELQHLSGPEVLLEVKKAMDEANVPMKEQIFYLESIANDASKLIPLLEDNGQAYHELAQEAEDLNLVLSQQDISNLRDMDKELKKVSQTLSASFAQAVVGASDQISWLTDRLAEAVTYWGAFFDSMRDDPKTIEGLNTKLIDLTEEMDDLNKTVQQHSGRDNDRSKYIVARSQARITQIEQEIEALQKLREMQMGVPQGPNIPEPPPLPQPQQTGGTGATGAADEIIAENQRVLDSLARDLATQRELVYATHAAQVASIQNLVLTEEQIRAAGYETMAELQADYIAKSDAALIESLDSLEAHTEETAQTTESLLQDLATSIGANTQALERASTSWANSFSTELANMVTQGEMDFGRLAESIINDLIRIAIQANITEPLLTSMGLMTPTTGKATGGPVMRGSTYLVGERGPELFTASNTGTIVPNNRLGGGHTSVNVYTQPGETAETRTRSTPQGDVVELFMKQIDSRMNEQISRGQGLARTLEGRYALSRKAY